MHNVPTTLGESIIAAIDYSIRNFRYEAMLFKLAEQNISVVRGKIIEYVAKMESWDHVDPTSYGSFDVACQSLYLKHNILIRVEQKEMSSPSYSFTQFESAGFTKVFYDHELNASDPYFDVIKRDYYNEVSS